MRTTYKTTIQVYNEVLDCDIPVAVEVEYIYEREWPSTEWDPGEPELFEISSIKDIQTGKELTEDDIDMDMICEELETEIRESLSGDDY